MLLFDCASAHHPGKGSLFLFELDFPEVEIASDTAQHAPGKTGQIEVDGKDDSSSPLIVPPQAEMQKLHRLALLGNMRDISDYAGHIGSLDPRYQFAQQLKQLAETFKSKVILVFVERHSK